MAVFTRIFDTFQSLRFAAELPDERDAESLGWQRAAHLYQIGHTGVEPPNYFTAFMILPWPWPLLSSVDWEDKQRTGILHSHFTRTPGQIFSRTPGPEFTRILPLLTEKT